MPSAGLVFHLIPHTHWDREWYLPAAAFRARLVAMMDDLLARLAGEPAFRTFLLDGQTVLLEDYLAVRPDRGARVGALVREGRLQAGPWYVLADEQIPSGESLIRNLLLGAADAARLGGRSDVLYSPDAFGHPESLPDVAREFALPWAVVWRGLASHRDFVRWRGPAGGEVLAYHLPPEGYEVGAALAPDAARLRATWPAIRAGLVERALTRHVAVFVGADHHWAHPGIVALRDALAALEPEHEVRLSRLDEFFAAAAPAAGGATVVAGELRSGAHTWVLQGALGTRAHLKRRNSTLELFLGRVVEPLVALADPAGSAIPVLRDAWRRLIRNQFHDSICGTASDRVAATMAARFDAVEAAGRELARRALYRTAGHDPDRARAEADRARPALVLWNPAVRERGGVVLADLSFFRRDVLVGPPGGRVPRHGRGLEPLALDPGHGRPLEVQIVGRRVAQRRLDADRHYPDQDEVDLVRVAFRAPVMAGLAATVLREVGADVGLAEPWRGGSEHGPAAARRPDGVRASGNRVANELVGVSIGPDGSLRLTDRRTGARHGGLLRLETEGDAGDTYTFAPIPGDSPLASRGPARVRVLARGPLVGVLEARWPLPRARGAARVVVRLHVGSPLVHCRLEVANAGTDHRLRARVPLGAPGSALLAGAQFGVVERSPVPRDPASCPREAPVPTFPVHRFAAGRGLAVLAPGFFEGEWTGEGDLLLTVLRAIGWLSREDLPARPGHAGWPEPVPLAQCLGSDALELALVPLARDRERRADLLHRWWEDAFLPVQGWWIPDAIDLAVVRQSVELAGAGLVPSAVKPAESGAGIVLRCLNVADAPVAGRWRFGAPARRAWRIRADEGDPRPVELSDGGRELRFQAPPRGWTSHRIEPGRDPDAAPVHVARGDRFRFTRQRATE